jgi:hypothetical protein
MTRIMSTLSAISCEMTSAGVSGEMAIPAFMPASWICLATSIGVSGEGRQGDINKAGGRTAEDKMNECETARTGGFVVESVGGSSSLGHIRDPL